jgi:hypothetical protein
MPSTVILFDKYKKLSHTTISVPDDRSSVQVDVFTKRDGEEPSYRVSFTREQIQSSKFMDDAKQVYDSLPKNSKLLAFARDFTATIHPEEYINYSIHAQLQPIFEKTDATFVGLIAAVIIQLLQGKDIKSWLPEHTYYNGIFLRHGDEISGKLPTSVAQLREWNPTEIHWR